MKWWLRFLLAGCAALPLACGGEPNESSANTSTTRRASTLATPTLTKRDFTYAFIVLNGAPAIDQVGNVASESNPDTVKRVRARLAKIKTQHARLRSAIRADGATIVGELDLLANAIEVFGTRAALRSVLRLPGVKRLDRVTLYTRSLAPEVQEIGASKVWQRTTPLVGDGMRVAIVDSGIDYTHADFGGPGTVAAYQNNNGSVIEPGTFPTQKVIGGYDFVGDAYDATQASTANPEPDPDPLDCLQPGYGGIGGHGTHVSGIVAGEGVLTDGSTYTGPYNESLDPNAFNVFPGIAPRAKLYAFKIFGCTGSTAELDQALERAADPNQDGDLSDHVDVVNASLGTSYGPVSDTEEQVVQNLEKAGTLLVVAAGNDGNAFFATGSPAVYPEVLSVAASQASSYLALTIDSPSAIAGNVPAVEGTLTTRLSSTGAVGGTLVYTQPHDACSALTNAAALNGNVALVDRGTCEFQQKLTAIANAGAKAAIVVDDVDESTPISMGGGRPGTVSIPGVMIRQADGKRIEAQLASGVTVTLDPNQAYTGPGSEGITDFSSRGPSSTGNLLKPEISAPGYNVSSARIGSGNQAVSESGTSMACPMVTGSAALLREAQPDLTPPEVKAVLMNSTDNLVDLGGNSLPVSMQGGGRVDIDSAVTRTVSAAEQSDDGAVGVSFGSVVADKTTSLTRTVVVTNHGSNSVDYSLSVKRTDTLPGVTVKVSPQTLSVAAGATANATVTLTVDPTALGAPGPDPETPAEITVGYTQQTTSPRQYITEANGLIEFNDASSAQSLTLPYYAVVRGASDQQAGPITGCSLSLSKGPLTIPMVGNSAAPVPVVSAFELGMLDQNPPPTNPEQAMLGIKAVGVATDAADKDFADASAYFGVALDADWTTPALGLYSLVSVLIDTNADGQADYEIDAEPGTQAGPYFDVLYSTTNDATTSQPTDSQELLNLEPATKVQTFPFDNSVVVFGVSLHSLNLTADNAKFQYAIVTHGTSIFNAGTQTPWMSYDPMHAAIDTTKGGVDGFPIYTGNKPVKVYLGSKASSGSLPKLLLLHHTNMAGSRVETVDLSQETSVLEGGDLNLVLARLPGETKPNTPFTVQFIARNDSDSSRAGVSVSISVDGATASSVTATQGSCTHAKCDLGTMDPHGKATITIVASAPTSTQGKKVTIDATAASTAACETNLSNNTVSADVAIARLPTYQPAGGCACRAAGQRSSHGGFALAFGALAWVELERRRRARARRGA
jgi:subtilisin family serine protease